MSKVKYVNIPFRCPALDYARILMIPTDEFPKVIEVVQKFLLDNGVAEVKIVNGKKKKKELINSEPVNKIPKDRGR